MPDPAAILRALDEMEGRAGFKTVTRHDVRALVAACRELVKADLGFVLGHIRIPEGSDEGMCSGCGFRWPCAARTVIDRALARAAEALGIADG